MRDRIVIVAVLAVAWQVAGTWLGAEQVSSPLLVLTQLWAWLSGGVLLGHAGYTLLEALLGFAIGAVPGLLLPLALRRQPFLAAVLDPFIVLGYGLPKVAFIPLFIVWFGIGIWSKVALVASVSFFIVFFSTTEGVRAVDPRLVRMARIAGANERQLLRTVVLPAATPFIVQAVQVALPLSIGGAAIAELISSNRGLGYLIQSSAGNFEMTGALAGVVALTLIVAAANAAVTAAERRLMSWRPTGAAARAPGDPT
jgi:NitT/TauT family transport system permease protein